ncbi:aminopeptidase P family protein [Fusibacter paucivorans]|uniref:Aminopeptidase P family protein n=1 Tax=Fusibacter paucivorans TaxID=76009 RepID=A0ABS5PQ79_9FIRM|nr:Xaa-Pro peptidase family protein [Fusibacter paucivorans]MBS7527324.1 aminopeptidase P family protein [Fusibacter paucivorans]
MVQNERVKKTRAAMQQNGVDALLITTMADIRYYTEIDFHSGERFVGLLMTQDKLLLIINKLFPMLPTAGLTIQSYDDIEEPVKYVVDQLPDGITIGIDKFMASQFLLRIINMRSDLKLTLGSAIVDRVKMVKTKEEVSKMIKASQINDRVMDMVAAYLKAASADNVTELEVAAKIAQFNESVGIDELSFTPIVCFGKNAAEPHHENDETVLEDGMGIIVDMGGLSEGYCSDMTRTFFKGQPDEQFKKVYEIVKTANERAIATVKPGVKLSEVDAAARQYITEMGYGDYFTHRTGHGIGADVHEFPDVSAVSDVICEPGMTFSIEPGIYLTDKFGIRIEDLVCVTEEGCRVLNDFSKNLINFK